jgi:hypothetical protein
LLPQNWLVYWRDTVQSNGLSNNGISISDTFYYIINISFPSSAHQRVSSILKEEFTIRASLDFNGVFFTVAVKEGCSEIIHADWNDNPDSLSWIVPIGNWEGGEWCSPQLGLKFPVQAGQVLAATTHRLVHCSAPITHGQRLIFTLFTDKYLMKSTSDTSGCSN